MWGGYGMGEGQFNHPVGIDVDRRGENVYVTDLFNNRVQRFAPDGRFLLQWGGPGRVGSGEGDFLGPAGVAVAPAPGADDVVYVTDNRNNRVQKFTADGEFLLQWGERGSEPGQFAFADLLDTDADGNVYVADTLNNRTQKFTRDGEHVLAILPGYGGGGDGRMAPPPYGPRTFDGPHGVAVAPDGSVYVTDWVDDVVQRFSSGGELLAVIGDGPDERGRFQGLHGIAVDAAGDVWVTETHNHRIQRLSANGRPLAMYGREGGRPGTGRREFEFPEGIAVDCRGNVYVTDSGPFSPAAATGNNRVQKLAGVAARGRCGNGTRRPATLPSVRLRVGRAAGMRGARRGRPFRVRVRALGGTVGRVRVLAVGRRGRVVARSRPLDLRRGQLKQPRVRVRRRLRPGRYRIAAIGRADDGRRVRGARRVLLRRR